MRYCQIVVQSSCNKYTSTNNMLVSTFSYPYQQLLWDLKYCQSDGQEIIPQWSFNLWFLFSYLWDKKTSHGVIAHVWMGWEMRSWGQPLHSDNSTLWKKKQDVSATDYFFKCFHLIFIINYKKKYRLKSSIIIGDLSVFLCNSNIFTYINFNTLLLRVYKFKFVLFFMVSVCFQVV